VAEPTFKNLRELDQNFFQGQFSIISNFQPNFLLDTTPLNSNYDFFGYFRKKFRKKSGSIFSKVSSKESKLNTNEKVGLRQDDILKFKLIRVAYPLKRCESDLLVLGFSRELK
jgi:hypothetical protein